MHRRGLVAESIPASETDLSDSEATVELTFSADTAIANVQTTRFEEDPGTIDEWVLLEIPFVFDDPFTIRVELATSARTQMPNFPGAASAISDFANTLAWQGVQFVDDADGDSIAEYQINADSQTDYRGAIVPEPASGALAALALTGAAWRRQRRDLRARRVSE